MADSTSEVMDVGSNFRKGFWRLADPKVSLASIASMFLGACLAARVEPIEWRWLLFTVVGILAVEIAKNASGEIVDFDSGADLAVAPQDRSPFSGGKRVLVDRLLTRRETAAIAVVCYALAIAVGLYLTVARDARVLGLGLVGLACAYFYHARPLRLSYRGLGEVAVALCYGPLVCAGTYLVQTGTMTCDVIWLGIGLGMLIGAFLWINEFPDFTADHRSGKRTLVVRMGRARASRAFAVILAVGFLALAVAPALTAFPRTVWWGLLGLPFAGFAARRASLAPETTSRIVAAQTATLLAFLSFALGAGIGALL
jgi:1,4-dihydroxy-2-naphthoate octaprenyltransferase